MTLLELNETIGEYTDEQYELITEAFNTKKITKRVNKYANRISKAIEKAEKKGKLSDSEINRLKNIRKKAEDLNAEFEKIENAYKSKNIKKKDAKNLIKKIKQNNDNFFKDVRKAENKAVLKKVGIAGAIIGLLALTGGILNSKGIIDIPGLFHKASNSGLAANSKDAITKGADKAGELSQKAYSNSKDVADNLIHQRRMAKAAALKANANPSAYSKMIANMPQGISPETNANDLWKGKVKQALAANSTATADNSYLSYKYGNNEVAKRIRKQLEKDFNI